MNQLVRSESWLSEIREAKPLRVWGIDLGTTNSTLAEITWSPGDGGVLPECRCLDLDQPTEAGVYTSPLVASVLAILPSGEHWVGEGAKRLRTRPQEAALFVERTLFFETKNDMGLRKTYYRAGEAYNHAHRIAGHILKFMKAAAEEITGATADRIVVTVPASFQLNQRRDTLKAAAQAGLELRDHDLLDEPTAALLDYLFTHPREDLIAPGRLSKGVIFDFGGGTCDVSIVEIEASQRDGNFRISPLAVSRYHRLGGGDLDAAIVYEQLLPVLIAENGLGDHELKWEEKKRALEPQLLGTAEALKLALCSEIDRLEKFGRYKSADKATIVAKQPALTCTLGRRQLTLSRPTLSASQWEAILEPFLDRDHLYTRETEYRLTQSVFAPLQDALDRAKLEAKEVSFCLLVGGSTLIPQARAAIAEYFAQAHTVTFADSLAVQTAVARGAAWHAFFLAAIGKPIVQPVTNDSIALMTGEGEPYELIPAGTAIPFPADGTYARKTNLAVPRAMVGGSIGMEVVAGSTGQAIFNEKWLIHCLVNAGEGIEVEYRLSATQEFDLRAFLTNDPDSVFERTVENPLVNVMNPNQVRLQIEELEERLRKKGGPKAEDRDELIQLAGWYAELRQYEKALTFLSQALRLINRPDDGILILEGIYAGELGDYEREERAYRAADQANRSWGGPMFNLALSFHGRKKYEAALQAIDRAIEKNPSAGAYRTLRARCLRSLGKGQEATKEGEEAFASFEPIPELDDWTLGWFIDCAKTVGRDDAQHEAQKERSRRASTSRDTDTRGGDLPIITGGLTRQ